MRVNLELGNKSYRFQTSFLLFINLFVKDLKIYELHRREMAQELCKAQTIPLNL